MKHIRDKRTVTEANPRGTVLPVSDAVAEMVLKNPDIELVEDDKPKRQSRKTAESPSTDGE